MFACLDGSGKSVHYSLNARCDERDRNKNSKDPKGRSTYKRKRLGRTILERDLELNFRKTKK